MSNLAITGYQHMISPAIKAARERNAANALAARKAYLLGTRPNLLTPS